MEAQPSLANRLVRGTALNAGGALASRAMELAFVAISVKRVGVAAFGLVVIAESLTQWPAMFEAGVGQHVTRLFAGRRQHKSFSALFGAAALIYLGLGLAALGFGLFVSHFVLVPVFGVPSGLKSESIRAFDLLAVAGAIRLARQLLARGLTGQLSFGGLRATDLSRLAVLLALTIGTVPSRGSGVVALATVLLASEIVAAVVAIGFLGPKRRHGLRFADATRAAMAEHWHESVPLIASNVIGVAWTRIDPVIVAVALGPVGTGTYGIVVRAYELLRNAVELVFAGVIPAASHLVEQSEPRRVKPLFVKAAKYAAVLTWPVAAVVGMFGDQIVQAWIGRSIPDADATMAAAMLVVVVMTVPSAALYVIVGAGRVRRVVRTLALAAMVNFAIGASTVMTLGVKAVFIGTIVGTIPITVRYVREVAELAEVSARQLLDGLWTALVVSGAFAGVVALTRALEFDAGTTGVVIAGAFLVYVAAVWRWVVDVEDIGRLRR